MSDKEEEPLRMGSTHSKQCEIRAWADKAFAGQYDLRTVFKKAKAEMYEVAEELSKDELTHEQVAEEIADVVLALLLMGSLLERDIGLLVSMKLMRNMRRKWQKEEDGTWQHVESEDGQKLREKQGLDEVSTPTGGQADLPLQPVPDEDNGGR